MPSSTVAVFGLGSMGTGMARCLARTGVSVRAFAEETGSVACSSAMEAGQHADAAIVVVLNADQARDAIFGEFGLAGSLPRNAPIVCMSTMAPARTRALAEEANAVALRWV